MAGLFSGLELGKRALLANQVYLQTIGHNIANVNTPGYTRQRVHIAAFHPSDTPFGPIGTGVVADDIRHVRDLFLGQQYRQEQKSLGQWTYKQKVLTQIESLFAEPSNNTLSDRLDEFWNAWDDVAKDPGNTARNALVGATDLLTNSFHDLYRQLGNLRDSIDDDLKALTDDVNQMASEIAHLNQKIKIQELDGSRANDLRDTRDQLIDDLSVLVDVNTIEEDHGGVRVLIGSLEIVNGADTNPIETRTVKDGGHLLHELVWQGTTVTIKNLNGQLKGLIEARDYLVPRYMAELDTLAQSIIAEVNSLHRTGYGLNGSTGNDFFDEGFLSAGEIKMNTALLIAPEKIAASGSGEVGDGTIALAIQALRNERVMVSNTSTMNGYYNSIIGKLGVETHEALSFTENYELSVQMVKNARESIQGVSLDEEMANMIKYQHAYDAAARVITTMDEALDVVISRMGIVGR